MVRDSAKADADRAEARAGDRSAELTPEIVKRFAGEAKRRLRTDAGDYRRHHLQALAQRIEVGEDTIRIKGTRTHLLRILAGEGVARPFQGRATPKARDP
jgi:site-specific DNA recombinase